MNYKWNVDSKTINFAKDIEKLQFRLSDLLGPAGAIMSDLGTDVIWKIGKLETMFTGVQFDIDMEVALVDMSVSSLKSATLNKAMDILSAVGLDVSPLYVDNINFLKAVGTLAKDVDPSVKLPTWLQTGYITIGKLSPACSAENENFGVTVMGLTPAQFDNVSFAQVLTTAVNKELGILLPACSVKTTPVKNPCSGGITNVKPCTNTKTASSLECAFTGLKIDVSATRRLTAGGVVIRGQSKPGAGMNAVAINQLVKQQVQTGKLGTYTTDKEAFSGSSCPSSGCTCAKQKTCPHVLAQHTTPAPAAAAAPGHSASGASAGAGKASPTNPGSAAAAPAHIASSTSSCGAGCTAGAVIGTLLGVTGIAALAVVGLKKHSEAVASKSTQGMEMSSSFVLATGEGDGYSKL